MKILSLKDFFNKVNYDWNKDKEKIKTICHYTKTRVNPKIKEVRLTWGTEQTFIIKAIAEWLGAQSFFEIGTGRGTACYSTCLVPTVKEIHTVDILKFNQKFATAIGHKPVTVSLSNIFDMIPYKEKSKIKFHHRKEFKHLDKNFPNGFDFCFIDGDHTSEPVIMEDYAVCLKLMKDDGIVIWDDYDPERFAVKNIVENILQSNPELDAVLIEQRGHLFTDKPKEHGKGMVLMKKGKLFNE